LLGTDVVLVEAVWTLRSAFEQDKHALVIAVRSLLEETAFAFEDRQAIAEALAHLSQLEADTMAKWLILHGTKPKVFTTRQLRR